MKQEKINTIDQRLHLLHNSPEFRLGFRPNMLVRDRRASPASGNTGKEASATNKRAPLTNITNQSSGGGSRASVSSSPSKVLVPCDAKVAKTEAPVSTHKSASMSNGVSKTEAPVRTHGRSFTKSTSAASLDSKLNLRLPSKTTSLEINHKVSSRSRSCPAPKSVVVDFMATSIADLSPGNGIMDTSSQSSKDSTSTWTTTSTCDSWETLQSECIDDEDAMSTKSIGRASINSLISDKPHTPGSICERDVLMDMEMDHRNKLKDTQFCATFASDIYENLRLSEMRRRPGMDFIERVQKDINASMRAVLINWLVEVSEEYQLAPQTLFLSVNYIDRYLSGNTVNRKRLQLLGVSCMMIAAKYEEICPPRVEEFCYITDGAYCKEEVLQMESLVLRYLKFEMTAPTANCFLRWFVWVAHGFKEAPSIQLECLAQYVAELSLLEYSMLCFAPSLVAASAVFLAKFMLSPLKKPWNSGLGCYTLYRPSDLCRCVKALHLLYRSGHNSNITAVRQKYSQHKYKFVAKKYCPPSIPEEFFND